MKRTSLLFLVMGLLISSSAMAQSEEGSADAGRTPAADGTKPGKYKRRDGTHGKKSAKKSHKKHAHKAAN